MSFILIILYLLNQSYGCVNEFNKKKQDYDYSKNKFTKSNCIINTNQDIDFYQVELLRRIEPYELLKPDKNKIYYFYGHLTIPIIYFILIKRI